MQGTMPCVSEGTNWGGGGWVPVTSGRLHSEIRTTAGKKSKTVTLNGVGNAKSLTLGVTGGSAHQTLAIQGVDCATTLAQLVLANGGTIRSKGVLALTGAGCGGNNHAYLTINSPAVLTNTGTIISTWAKARSK